MPVKISALDSASTPLSGRETLVLNQNGVTYTSPLSVISNYVISVNSLSAAASLASKVDKTTTVNGFPLSGNVIITTITGASGDVTGATNLATPNTIVKRGTLGEAYFTGAGNVYAVTGVSTLTGAQAAGGVVGYSAERAAIHGSSTNSYGGQFVNGGLLPAVAATGSDSEGIQAKTFNGTHHAVFGTRDTGVSISNGINKSHIHFNQGGFRGNLENNITADRNWILPDVTGTIALTSSNISGNADTATNVTGATSAATPNTYVKRGTVGEAAFATTNSTSAVNGTSSSTTSGTGAITGTTTATSALTYGVKGITTSSSNASKGVHGTATNGRGVQGDATSTGHGVYATAFSGSAVLGSSTNGFGGNFSSGSGTALIVDGGGTKLAQFGSDSDSLSILNTGASLNWTFDNGVNVFNHTIIRSSNQDTISYQLPDVGGTFAMTNGSVNYANTAGSADSAGTASTANYANFAEGANTANTANNATYASQSTQVPNSFFNEQGWGTPIFNASGLTDLTATQVANTPAGSIAATNVQTAINELDTEKLAIGGTAVLATDAVNVIGATDAATGSTVVKRGTTGQANFATTNSTPASTMTSTSTSGGSTALNVIHSGASNSAIAIKGATISSSSSSRGVYGTSTNGKAIEGSASNNGIGVYSTANFGTAIYGVTVTGNGLYAYTDSGIGAHISTNSGGSHLLMGTSSTYEGSVSVNRVNGTVVWNFYDPGPDDFFQHSLSRANASANIDWFLPNTGGTLAISSQTVNLIGNQTVAGEKTFTTFVSVPRGGASTFAKVGGSIFESFVDVSVGGAEADIFTNTLDTSLFGINGQKVVAEYSGNFVSSGTESIQLLAKFAGTTIWDSAGVAPSAGTTSWRVQVTLIRVSATVVRYSVALNTTGASGYNYCSVGEVTGLTLTNTNILKLTGTSSGVGSGAGDIIGKMHYVEYKSQS